MKRNTNMQNEMSSNTIDNTKKNNQNVLDCSTLSTHSINEMMPIKREQSRPISKAALHYIP